MLYVCDTPSMHTNLCVVEPLIVQWEETLTFMKLFNGDIHSIISIVELCWNCEEIQHSHTHTHSHIHTHTHNTHNTHTHTHTHTHTQSHTPAVLFTVSLQTLELVTITTRKNLLSLSTTSLCTDKVEKSSKNYTNH